MGQGSIPCGVTRQLKLKRFPVIMPFVLTPHGDYSLTVEQRVVVPLARVQLPLVTHMLPTISKNRYLNALFLLMLLSAIVHTSLMFFLAITAGDPKLVNFFSIIQLNLLWPDSAFLSSMAAASVTAGAIYLFFFWLSKKSKD